MANFSFKDNINKIGKSGLKDLIATELDEVSFLSTNVVVMNLVFSGKIMGGIKKGTINTICAPSAEGKSLIGLNCLKSAQKAGMDCVVVDSERAFPFSVAKALGIDMSKIPVYQAVNIGDIKRIYAMINEGAKAKERKNIFVLFDSWGPLVFTGLMDKAEKGSDTADMGRTAGFKNELANIINAYGNTTFCVNHVYDSLQMYGEKFCIPGGRRLFFLSDGIGLALSEAQWKSPEDDSYMGKLVTMGVKKGRSARERGRVQFAIRADGALDPFYGLFDDAIESGVLKKVAPGKYVRDFAIIDKKTGEDKSDIDIDTHEPTRTWREADMYCNPADEARFWIPIFQNPDFVKYVESKYTYEADDMLSAKYDIVDMINGDQELPSEEDLYEEVEDTRPNDSKEAVTLEDIGITSEEAIEPVTEETAEKATKKGKKKAK